MIAMISITLMWSDYMINIILITLLSSSIYGSFPKHNNFVSANITSYEDAEDRNYHEISPDFIDDSFYDDIFIPNQTVMSEYYYHLGHNIPWNSYGICGYTAMAMFLSFYDTYWNDNVINEIYESDATCIPSSQLYSGNAYESPGVNDELFGYGYSYLYFENLVVTENPGIIIGSDEYKDKLDKKLTPMVYEQIDHQTFLGKLFFESILCGVLKPHRDREGVIIDNNQYILGLGSNYNTTTSTLNQYILTNPFLHGNVSLVTSEMSTTDLNDSNYLNEKQRIREEIIAIIQSGRPAIVGGNSWDDSNANGIIEQGEEGGGHVCVAYDYNPNLDIIYGNLGYGPGQTHVNIEDKFNFHIHDYWAFNIGEHAFQYRTNNYYLTDKTSYYSPGVNSFFNVIHPTDFGFPDAYNQTEITSLLTISAPTSSVVNETVNVKRVRTGYIHHECINLSTKRKYPGIAYLDLAFPRDIKSLTVDISWWSSNEMVSPLNSQYRIQSKEGLLYYDYADIWYEGITTDRFHPSRLVIDFEQDISEFRFFGSTTDYANDRNKGRLSIFDMTIEYWDSL